MPQQSPIRMTDHALLRWLERAGLIDVEALRSEIEARLDRSHIAASLIGATDYLIVAHDMVYVVRKSHVTTVINDNGHRAHLLDHKPYAAIDVPSENHD